MFLTFRIDYRFLNILWCLLRSLSFLSIFFRCIVPVLWDLWNQLPDSFRQPRQSTSRLTSSFTCQLIFIIITTLIIHHSFTPGSKPTFSTNPSHLRLLLPTGLPSWQRDWTGPIMLIVLFLVSHFNFLFVPCGGLSWLPVSFLLHVKYTLSYRIVSYRMGPAAWF